MLLISALLSNSRAVASSRPPESVVMKAKVQARGVGQGVRVTLADKTEAKGLIVSISEESFALKVKGGDQPQEIQFAQVTSVHKDKMGTGTKVIIVVAIVGVAIGITAAVIDHEVNNSLKHLTF
jgi:hypothetical protein